ncbi:MAG: AbrB/MazE/SpoVT family DNA-binding domain-containing protein [Clostridia bacterium]|nr:AbrB/MazE/SpoVT family DNA-binding domain-containing protein [Clostridia bacterium]
MEENNKYRFIVSVKVGPKGQITIPSQAREMFNIKVGDTLMILGDISRGLAILKDDAFYNLMDGRHENDGN